MREGRTDGEGKAFYSKKWASRPKSFFWQEQKKKKKCGGKAPLDSFLFIYTIKYSRSSSSSGSSSSTTTAALHTPCIYVYVHQLKEGAKERRGGWMG
jgi:hypothetical protein